MEHQGLKPIIVCSSYDPGLTLNYYLQGQIMECKLLFRKNLTVMDSLEIIAACDLEIG